MDVDEGSFISASNLSVDYQEFTRDKGISIGKISDFRAINDVNFHISSDEIVALLGRNGAGKTTLLGCLAGMLRPSLGKVNTRGRVIILRGVDPGLIPDLTGRENIRELGAAYGIPKSEIEAFISSVEEFSGLEEAFDRRYGGYSSGMRGKLGFGFITTLDPDILIIDETLGVGDLQFRAKAQLRLRELIDRSGIVVVSTHSLGLAKEICQRGIVLDQGEMIFDGPIVEAIEHYTEISNN